LHGHAAQPGRDLTKAFHLLGPAGIRNPAAGESACRPALDPVFEAARLTVNGNQIIPAPGGRRRRRQSEHAISQRIAQMVVEEQPAIQVLVPKLLLNFLKLHIA